jgi:hypothetical protein
VSEVPLAAVVKDVLKTIVPPVSEVPLAAVQQRELTMHPHFMTAMLRVDAIPIHPARTYPPGEDHRVGCDGGWDCLIKQLQRQGFAIMCLPGWSGRSLRLPTSSTRRSPAPNSGRGAGAPTNQPASNSPNLTDLRFHSDRCSRRQPAKGASHTIKG